MRAHIPRPTTLGHEIEALAAEALRSWAEAQTAEGHFPNPVAAEVLAGHGGFSPPMLTYALRRAGLDCGRRPGRGRCPCGLRGRARST